MHTFEIASGNGHVATPKKTGIFSYAGQNGFGEIANLAMEAEDLVKQGHDMENMLPESKNETNSSAIDSDFHISDWKNSDSFELYITSLNQKINGGTGIDAFEVLPLAMKMKVC